MFVYNPFEVMKLEKEKLINLILEVDDERIIHYLLLFAKDFIFRHSEAQITAQSESEI